MERKITVKEWCEQYLAEKESGWSDVTRNSYAALLGDISCPEWESISWSS